MIEEDNNRKYIEALFIRRLDELERLVNSIDPIDTLDISRPIRQLLLDGRPLINEVNRKYKLKIRFRVFDIAVAMKILEQAGIPKMMIATIQDGLDPETAPPGDAVQCAIREIGLNEFLNITVLTLNDREFTIRNIIQFEANARGAVHFGPPKGREQEEIAMINRQLILGGYTPSSRQLRSIGRVVLKALRPLREAID